MRWRWVCEVMIPDQIRSDQCVHERRTGRMRKDVFIIRKQTNIHACGKTVFSSTRMQN